MVLYKILSQRHPDCDPELDQKLGLLLKGGPEIIKQAKLFINQVPGESAIAYKNRLTYASYHPYIPKAVLDFSTCLFSKQISVVPQSDSEDPSTAGELPEVDDFWNEFSRDCDMADSSISQFVQETYKCALGYGRAFVGIDFPNPAEMSQELKEKELPEIGLTLGQEEAFGTTRAYCYHIPIDTVVNYEYDDYGQLKWIMLCSVVPDNNPLAENKEKIVQFKLWQREGGVTWSIYEKRYPLNHDPKPNDDFPLIDSGKVSFKQIPIITLCLPEGLDLGPLLYCMAVEHFKLRSSLLHSESRSLFAIPFYQQGGAFDKDGNPIGGKADDDNRGINAKQEMINRGITVGSITDAFSYVEPEGRAYQLMNDQIKDLEQNILGIVNLMAQSAGAIVKGAGRSGLSKVMDNKAKEMVLQAYSIIVKDFIMEIYSCIGGARGENVYWQVMGMDDYKIIDRDSLINEIMNFDKIKMAIPSKTFIKQYQTRLASDIEPELTPTVQLTIFNEIMDSVVDFTSPEEKQAQINSKSLGSDQSTSNGIEDSGGAPDLPVGESGFTQGYEGMHTQTGQHIDAQTVYNQLAEDYKDKDIQFVLHIPWVGPQEVPLSSIDFSNKDNWQAAQSEDQEHVDMFADKMKNDNYSKPIILVNNPSNDNKMMVVDGHHRALAALQNGTPVAAYIGHIGTDRGPWDKLHAKQKGSKEESIQKEVNQQVNKSEMAKGGKTK